MIEEINEPAGGLKPSEPPAYADLTPEAQRREDQRLAREDMPYRMATGWAAVDRGRIGKHMSRPFRRALNEAEQRERADAAREDRDRAQRAAIFQERSMRASIELALARGEDVNFPQAWDRGGVGHTRAEFIALMSAEQDVEDARENARRAHSGMSDKQWSDMHSADTSAPDIHSAMGAAEHQRAIAEQERIAARIAAGRSLRQMDRRARRAAQGETRRLETAVHRVVESLIDRGVL